MQAIATVKTVANFIEPVTALVDECKLHLEPDQARIAAVDPANVAMVETTLSASAFESYEADGHTLGLDLDTFEDVLGLGDASDLVFLRLDESTQKLNIEIAQTDYRQALLDPGTIRSEPEIPELGLPNTAVLTSDQLAQAEAAADLASDHLTIRAGVGPNVDPIEIRFEAAGDSDDVATSFDADRAVDLELTEPVSSLFSLDYVSDVVGAMPDDAEVTLRQGSEHPALLEWAHSDGRADVLVMISPRVAGDS